MSQRTAGVGKHTLYQRRNFQGPSGPKTRRHELDEWGDCEPSNLFRGPSAIDAGSVDRAVAMFHVTVHDCSSVLHRMDTCAIRLWTLNAERACALDTDWMIGSVKQPQSMEGDIQR